MNGNEKGIATRQVDHRERLPVNHDMEPEIEDSSPVDDMKGPTKIDNDDDSNPDEASDDEKDKIDNCVIPVDTAEEIGKAEAADRDIVAEKIAKDAESFSSRNNKGDDEINTKPESKISSLKKTETTVQKQLPVPKKGLKNDHTVNSSESITGTRASVDESSTDDPSSMNSSYVASSAENSGISNTSGVVLENQNSTLLASVDDPSTSLSEIHDCQLAPTASVVLASSSARQQSSDDPEMGAHIVEAEVVEDQEIVEAKVVTGDDDQGIRGRWSTRALLAVLVLVLLGIVAISLVVGLRAKGQVALPTEAPSSNIVQRTEVLRKILSPLSGDGVFDENSPEFSPDRRQALDWMVRDELLAIDDPSLEWKIRQRYVVALFHIATNGEGWKDQYYFDTGLDECNWSLVTTRESHTVNGGIVFEITGIICNKQGHVDRLLLGWNNLSGTLPHELSEFSDTLLEFSIGGGSISGNIPRSFEQMTNLVSFSINDNCFTGDIPDLSGATDLTTLRLHNNDGLSGSLENFCNGTELFGPMSEIFADCNGSVECECCNCCNQDTYECCLEDGTCQSSINSNTLTSSNVLLSFDKQCLSEKSKQWIQEECPCIYNKYNETGDNGDFEAVCTTDCNVEGASRSYDFSLRRRF